MRGEGGIGNEGNGGGKRGGKEREGKWDGSGPDQVREEIDVPAHKISRQWLTIVKDG